MIKKVCILIGRICISLIFFFSGICKMGDWQRTQTELVHTLSQWNSYGIQSAFWMQTFQDALGWAPLLLIAAMVLELLGAISIFLGFKARLGAFLLILFLIPTTILFHPFWFLEGSDRDLQMVMFLKNVAILGGLFLLLAFGSSSRPKVVSPPIMKSDAGDGK